ncbi:SgcJ/EcaC family oxidoreductase [Streptosporangium sp. NPDC004379]|uniref:SgcJ/EcaC family oxidoreductase n=1 Tax=Streptosporangium sp. NPDC004379 TaxID=3366189 RepID=UPI003691E6DD
MTVENHSGTIIEDRSATTREEDREAVLGLLHAVYAAWADNDADAFVAPYAEDATSILPGSYRRDREEIRARMAAGFAGPLKGSRVVDEVQSVRFPGADAAVVVSRSVVLMAGESEAPGGRQVMATWMCSRRDGGWVIDAYHNCPA